jgi:transcriptional regulator
MFREGSPMPEQTPSGAPAPDRFQGDADDVLALIGEFPLAWVTPRHPGSAELATLLPLLAQVDETGQLVSLLGHMARRNPLHAALEASPTAMILFTGPQAYVSPGLVSTKTWAPTWNYAQVRIEAEIQFRPDLGHEALDRLTRVMDADDRTGWSPRDVGPRYEAMEQAIIAFEARITGLSARFKLGQDEAEPTLRELLARHPDPVLTRWMRRMNQARLQV